MSQTKVDARGGVAIGNLSVELFLRNLTDEDAFTWQSVSLGGYRLRPRTIGIQLGYKRIAAQEVSEERATIP